MTSSEGASTYTQLRYKRLRAPKNHGQRLIDPPLPEIAGLLNRNVRSLRGQNYDCQGRPWQLLSSDARSGLLSAARSFTSEYQNVPDTDGEGPIILAGHQPELYHPGVWAKSFLIHRLARQSGGQAINLLIDNDTLRHPAVQAPAGSPHDPYTAAVPFDAPTAELPFEERRLMDDRYFTSFADRLQQTLRPLIAKPLVRSLWPCALDAARRRRNLGHCLAEARHRVEAEWGLRTMELPLSVICDTEHFRWFACHVLARIVDFRRIYNDSLREYRQINHIRSRTHPVPSLASEDDLLEAPFWIWTADDPQRRRVFVQCKSGRLELTDRRGLCCCLPLGEDRPADLAVERLGRFAAEGIRLRPRALMTTMYARLVLGDLFVHGIGGAKYDQLTDAIIERFFGFTPPGFVTATATARLPVARKPMRTSELTDVDRALRDLRFNPQRHIELTAKSDPLVRERLDIVKDFARGPSGRERHARIVQLNAELQPWVQQERVLLEDERHRIQQELRADRVLGSREYSFCLFPEESLRPFLLDI